MSTHPQSLMRLALLFTLLALLASLVLVRSAANARPVEPKFVAMEDGEVSLRHDERLPLPRQGVFGTAEQGTTWFGGTVWAADSMRWEAIEGGTWTFDSGVGSHFDHSAPYVNPYKDPALHAAMEGWVGIDNTYSDLTYFRRMSEADFTAESVTPCVGTTAGLGGSWSLWAGVLPSEANDLCYAAGMGYGNSWQICIEREFTLAVVENVTLEYTYINDTEPGWDYTFVTVDRTAGGDEVALTDYTGAVSGTETLVLQPGPTLPGSPGPFVIRFCVVADGAYSDEDGLFTTDCGAFAVDDISVTGGGINHTATFETGDDGWTLSPPQPGHGGEWSDIVHLDDLPPIEYSCPQYRCGLSDSVLVFADLNIPGGGHGDYQDNMAASPWIDLRRAGEVGKPASFLEYNLYFVQPGLHYIYTYETVQYYPYICPEIGEPTVSPWLSGWVVYYGLGLPQCRDDSRPVRRYLADMVPPEAEQVRVALGMVNYCRFYTGCTGETNTTPWYDDVRVGFFGVADAPYLTVRTIDTPQDAFPTDGTLHITSPGRVDCNDVKGSQNPEPFTSLGDTLVVSGASGGAEVYVVFAVDPGPGINQPRYQAWLAQHAAEGPWQGVDWYSARMDTAEIIGRSLYYSAEWMTAYHEEDPNFSGHDQATDPTDLDANGQMSRLANDIFPDDLFTPGTRLMLYYKTRFTGGTDWYTYPDTSWGGYLEMEVMPSSMAADSTFNCLLYVDHYDGRGAQPVIEPALRSVVAGGSANFENTPWDRWDVRAPSSGQSSFGRPLNTQYGATVEQALGYRMILWNSGNLNATNLSQEDANVLNPWLDYSVPGFGPRGLYLSGDGLAESIVNEASSAPAALQLLEQFCGVDFLCGRVGDSGCPAGSPGDTTSCMDLDPLGSARVAGALMGGRNVQHQGQGNGCLEFRSFDVLGPFAGAAGLPAGDENYESAIKGAASYASITNEVTGDANYRTVVDGVSLHYRREAGDCRFTPAVTPVPAVEQRLREVLGWFGGLSAELCEDLSGAVAVPPTIEPPVRPRLGLRVLSANPVVGSSRADFEITVPEGQTARLQVFDVAGRLVRTLHDGPAESTVLQLSWDRSDTAGRTVPSGIYFLRLAGERTIAKRLVVLR